jgi:hypothetical protein
MSVYKYWNPPCPKGFPQMIIRQLNQPSLSIFHNILVYWVCPGCLPSLWNTRRPTTTWKTLRGATQGWAAGEPIFSDNLNLSSWPHPPNPLPPRKAYQLSETPQTTINYSFQRCQLPELLFHLLLWFLRYT